MKTPEKQIKMLYELAPQIKMSDYYIKQTLDGMTWNKNALEAYFEYVGNYKKRVKNTQNTKEYFLNLIDYRVINDIDFLKSDLFNNIADAKDEKEELTLNVFIEAHERKFSQALGHLNRYIYNLRQEKYKNSIASLDSANIEKKNLFDKNKELLELLIKGYEYLCFDLEHCLKGMKSFLKSVLSPREEGEIKALNISDIENQSKANYTFEEVFGAVEKELIEFLELNKLLVNGELKKGNPSIIVAIVNHLTDTNLIPRLGASIKHNVPACKIFAKHFHITIKDRICRCKGSNEGHIYQYWIKKLKNYSFL